MPENLEPNYEYVKGKGWLTLTYKSITFEKGGWLITVCARKPQEGERWFAENPGTPLETTAKSIEKYTSHVPGKIGWGWEELVGSGRWTHIKDTEEYAWVAVIQEKL